MSNEQSQLKRSTFLTIAALLLSLLIAGCSSETSSVSAPKITLQSITLSPTTLSLSDHQTAQIKAIANYSDGSTQNVTTSASWQTSETVVADVAQGLVTANSSGASAITATFNGMISPPAIVAVQRTLTSISISPSSITMPVNFSMDGVKAIGLFSDNTTTDLTAQATWFSSDPSIATITQQGRANGITPGNAILHAQVISLDSSAHAFTSSAPINILPIKLLDYENPSISSRLMSAPRTEINGQGVAFVAWHNQVDGNIFISGHDKTNGWHATTQFSREPASGKTYVYGIDINDAGDRAVIWCDSSANGNRLYASISPAGQPFSTPQLLFSDPRVASFGPVSITLGQNGNALAVWGFAGIKSSEYNKLTSTWSTPIALGDSGAFSITRNNAGHALLVWQSRPGVGTQLNAVYFSPQPGGGWGAPQVIYSSNSPWFDPTFAINSLGEAIIVWDDQPAGSSTLHSKYFSPLSGWGADTLIPLNGVTTPQLPFVGLNDSGDAALVWHDLSYNLYVSRYSKAGGWLLSDVIKQGVGGPGIVLGAPSYLVPAINSLGEIKVGYTDYYGFKFDRYDPAVGWQGGQLFNQIGSVGSQQSISMRFHADGTGIMTWDEDGSIPRVGGGFVFVTYNFGSTDILF